MRARFGVSQANQPPSLPCTAPSHASTKPSASMVLALAGLRDAITQSMYTWLCPSPAMQGGQRHDFIFMYTWGLYRIYIYIYMYIHTDNGKEHGNDHLGVYKPNGKENENYYLEYRVIGLLNPEP